jgi:hypothetical protein
VWLANQAPRVDKRRHRSVEFVALLEDLNHCYPHEFRIRLIPQNHSAHLSLEIKTCAASHSNRFQYILTRVHGSWLNIVESLFGKMPQTFLKHVRIQSWEELRERILLGVAEIDAPPVVHRRGKFAPLDEYIF